MYLTSSQVNIQPTFIVFRLITQAKITKDFFGFGLNLLDMALRMDTFAHDDWSTCDQNASILKRERAVLCYS